MSSPVATLRISHVTPRKRSNTTAAGGIPLRASPGQVATIRMPDQPGLKVKVAITGPRPGDDLDDVENIAPPVTGAQSDADSPFSIGVRDITPVPNTNHASIPNADVHITFIEPKFDCSIGSEDFGAILRDLAPIPDEELINAPSSPTKVCSFRALEDCDDEPVISRPSRTPQRLYSATDLFSDFSDELLAPIGQSLCKAPGAFLDDEKDDELQVPAHLPSLCGPPTPFMDRYEGNEAEITAPLTGHVLQGRMLKRRRATYFESWETELSEYGTDYEDEADPTEYVANYEATNSFFDDEITSVPVFHEAPRPSNSLFGDESDEEEYGQVIERPENPSNYYTDSDSNSGTGTRSRTSSPVQRVLDVVKKVLKRRRSSLGEPVEEQDTNRVVRRMPKRAKV